jgi:hypothetical protein
MGIGFTKKQKKTKQKKLFLTFCNSVREQWIRSKYERKEFSVGKPICFFFFFFFFCGFFFFFFFFLGFFVRVGRDTTADDTNASACSRGLGGEERSEAKELEEKVVCCDGHVSGVLCKERRHTAVRRRETVVFVILVLVFVCLQKGLV